MTDRRLAWLGALVASLLLAGCPSPDTAGDQAAAPPAAPAAKPRPQTPVAGSSATGDGSPCEEVHRQVVTVAKDKPVSFAVPLERHAWYVVYAAAIDDTADPVLRILDRDGTVLGENDDFWRSKSFSAVALQLEEARTVTVEASCFEDNGGKVAVRVQKAGRLSPGSVASGVVEDFQGFYFYSLTAREGTIYQATCFDLADTLDTLLSLHDPTDLWLLSQCDDVAKDDLSSEIIWRCHKDGDYLLVVTAAGDDSSGAYKLGLKELPVAAEAPAPTAP